MTIRFKKDKARESGFSMLEMVIVVALMLIVMGVVFDQINLVQKRSRTEDMKVDLTQESREFMDQVVRDMHSVGYPTQRMYAVGILNSPPTSDKRVAVGLVKIAYDELWFEGDVNGDGNVAVIDYKLRTASGGNCPCKISRMQMSKTDGVAPMSQTFTSYSMELNDVVNSGGANGGATGTAAYTIAGYSGGQSNDTLYASYKPANVFTFYDQTGTEITPADYSTSAGQASLGSVRSVRININVLGRAVDLQTQSRPVMSYSVAVRLPNQ
jgi:type II secretory pathway pseudopilin PulG